MAEPPGEEVYKKKRRVFDSKEERVQATKDRKKHNDSRRISLGSSWSEYDRQRSEYGKVGNTEFMQHLLAVHEGNCSTCNIFQEDLACHPR